MLTENHLTQKQAEWAALHQDLKAREAQMLKDLIEFYDLKEGDVVEVKRDSDTNPVRIAIVEFELRDYACKYNQHRPVQGMPLLVYKGIFVTKQNRLHAAKHEGGFNTSYDFEVVGHFDFGKPPVSKYGLSTHETMSEPRQRAA